MVTVSTDKTTL